MCDTILGKGNCYVNKWGRRIVNDDGDGIVGDEQV